MGVKPSLNGPEEGRGGVTEHNRHDDRGAGDAPKDGRRYPPPKDTGGCAGDDQSSTGQQEKAFGPDGERETDPGALDGVIPSRTLVWTTRLHLGGMVSASADRCLSQVQTPRPSAAIPRTMYSIEPTIVGVLSWRGCIAPEARMTTVMTTAYPRPGRRRGRPTSAGIHIAATAGPYGIGLVGANLSRLRELSCDRHGAWVEAAGGDGLVLLTAGRYIYQEVRVPGLVDEPRKKVGYWNTVAHLPL